jgi:hypothetical protein
MALGHLHYYRDTNPVMADNARYTIREVLADHHGTSRLTMSCSCCLPAGARNRRGSAQVTVLRCRAAVRRYLAPSGH